MLQCCSRSLDSCLPAASPRQLLRRSFSSLCSILPRGRLPTPWQPAQPFHPQKTTGGASSLPSGTGLGGGAGRWSSLAPSAGISPRTESTASSRNHHPHTPSRSCPCRQQSGRLHALRSSGGRRDVQPQSLRQCLCCPQLTAVVSTPRSPPPPHPLPQKRWQPPARNIA